MMPRPGQDGGAFMRAMTAIGGLNSPQYADERARYVWYEASAVGVNLELWGGLVLATLMIWIGRASLLWWSLALFGMTVLTAVTTTAYAARRRAHIDLDESDYRSPVMVGIMLLVISYVVGLGRAALDFTSPHESGGGGGWVGVVSAVIGGILATIWGARSDARKRARRPTREVKSAGVVYEVDPWVGRVGQAVRACSCGSWSSLGWWASTDWARASRSRPR